MGTTDNHKISGLAHRYLSRVAEQRLELHQAVERLEAGRFTSLDDIHDLTHQIQRAASSFGYHQIAEVAATIHRFALEADVERLADRIPELTGLMVDFDLALSDAIGGNSERRGPPSRIKHLPIP